MKKFIFPLILSLFSLLLLTSCEEGGIDVKRISGVKITGFDDGVLMLKVGLLIDNSTGREVVVRGLKARVLFGGAEAGRITVTKKIRIRAETEETYQVPVKIELQDLGKLSRIFSQRPADGKKRTLHLKGVLRVRSGILCRRIPFDEEKMIRLL